MQSAPAPRIAVVGCGYWGTNHARTFAELGALHAVCDRHADRAGQLAGVHSVRAMTIEEVLADPEIDGWCWPCRRNIMPTRPSRLEAGKHVLVEKPIALSVADARRVVDAASRPGLVAMTGHVLRFHPAFEALEA
jgi:predicted dehydrogenase